MTPNDLARRAVACKGWRWMAGMEVRRGSRPHVLAQHMLGSSPEPRWENSMEDHALQIVRLRSKEDVISVTGRSGSSDEVSIVATDGEDALGVFTDGIARWQEERVYQDVVQAAAIGPFKLVYRREVMFRLYPTRSVVVAASLRRQYQKLFQVLWPDRTTRPSYNEHRVRLLDMLQHASFRTSFREGLRDIVIAELSVGKVRNATVRVPSADSNAIVELVGSHAKRLKRMSLEPRMEGSTQVQLTEAGGVTIEGSDESPLESWSRILPALAAVGVLESTDG